MKIDERTRFPYPVLCDWSSDYPNAKFGVELTVEEIPSCAEVSLRYRIALDEPQIERLIKSGEAAVGAYVICGDTYFSQLITFGLDSDVISFRAGELVGRVVIKPIIWVRRSIPNFRLDRCHEEFGGKDFHFSTGSILAQDSDIIVNVGLDKLAQIETIFSIVKDGNIADGTFEISPGTDKIKVMVAENIYRTVNEMRESKRNLPILISSLYLPVVMQVLDMLKDGSQSFDECRWYRVFSAKCDHLNIDIGSTELLRDAQRILQSPFSLIANKYGAKK